LRDLGVGIGFLSSRSSGDKLSYPRLPCKIIHFNILLHSYLSHDIYAEENILKLNLKNYIYAEFLYLQDFESWKVTGSSPDEMNFFNLPILPAKQWPWDRLSL
jgi:hypothetical protein